MNKRIGSTPFQDLLADSIASDPAIEAAAKALDAVLERSTSSIPHVLIFARLANDSGFINPVPMLPPMARLAELGGGLAELEPELLDLLGWQLHVESYDAGVNIQAKREMIQASLLLHRRRGTPWSVRHALETLLRIPTAIPEWFNYGGDPYFFRARLDVSGTGVDIPWVISALRIIMDYKNVRSWLEYLETFSTNPLPVYVATAAISRTMQGFRLWMKPEKPGRLSARTAMAETTVTRSYLYRGMRAAKPPSLPVISVPAVKTITRSHLCPRY